MHFRHRQTDRQTDTDITNRPILYLVAVDAISVAVLLGKQRRVCRYVESDVGAHLEQDGRRDQAVLDCARKQIRRRHPRQAVVQCARVWQFAVCQHPTTRAPSSG